MEILDVNQDQFVDLFAKAGEVAPQNQGQPKPFSFSGNSEPTIDILGTPPTQVEQTPPPVVPGAPASETAAGEENKGDGENPEADIFNDEKGKPGRPPKYNFSDASGYFEDRFKSGRFVAVTQETEDGKEIPFIPKTPEEFDEVIDIQVNYKLEQERKELEENWYTSKSPAWQAVSKYAEMTDNPADIIPFIQGVQNIETVSTLNPEDLGQAERIVRARLAQRGDDNETIDETIESLKTTDKLTSTAQKYKPAMVADEQRNLSTMIQQKRAEEQQYISLVNNIRENAVKAIESPFFGKQKLKQEEKAAIYDLIAEPSRETKGYQIYNAIDTLFEKGDFDTLKELALLISKKDSFMGYVNASAAEKTAESLQKKLRVASDGHSGGKETYSDDIPKVSRARYASTSAPRFGR